jgi:hypothetical protein
MTSTKQLSNIDSAWWELIIAISNEYELEVRRILPEGNISDDVGRLSSVLELGDWCLPCNCQRTNVTIAVVRTISKRHKDKSCYSSDNQTEP